MQEFTILLQFYYRVLNIQDAKKNWFGSDKCLKTVIKMFFSMFINHLN